MESGELYGLDNVLPSAVFAEVLLVPPDVAWTLRVLKKETEKFGH